MASKLKIIVDYPCDVYCDYEYKGQAVPNSIFSLILRKGTYFLEFKINDKIHKSTDYTIESNDQDDLLRVLLLSHIRFSKTNVDIRSKTSRIDENNDLCPFYGNIYVKWDRSDKEQVIKRDGSDKHFLIIEKPSQFYIICEEKPYETDENESIYRLEFPVVFQNGIIPQDISIDVKWLQCNYGEYYGIIAIYMDTIIIVYYIKKGKITNTKTVDASAGFLYNISDYYALTVINNQFGIYDLNTNKILCPNKFDELYCKCVEYHGEIYNGFYTTNKYSVELNGKKGVVDVEGKQLIPCIYDEANPCSLGYIVKKGVLWGLSYNGENPTDWYEDIFANYLTSYGIIKIHFGGITKEYIESVKWLMSSCLIYFKKGNKIGYWDVCGQRCKHLYDEIETDFVWGSGPSRLIKTRIGNKIGYIDCYGKEIIPCQYENIYIARHGNESLALYCDYCLYVEHNIKSEYISSIEQAAIKSGEYDADLPFKQLISDYIGYYDTCYIAEVNGKFGVCTVEGEKLISFVYDSIEGLPYDNFLVEKDGLYGILESDKKIVFPIRYTDKKQLENEFGWTLY